MDEGKIIQWRLVESTSVPGKHKIAGLYMYGDSKDITDRSDFSAIRTSVIAYYDHGEQVVTTRNSVYKLGNAADPAELEKLIELYGAKQ